MLAGTRRSTETRLRVRRTDVLRAAQYVVTALVLAGIIWALVAQWRAVEGHRLEARPRWGYVALSGIVFLATHALLVETWRRTLTTWGQRLGFLDAARIWSVSNLGRYVPGKVWQIAMMTVMAREKQVSGVAAAGSALLSTVVNIAAGIAIALATGWRAVEVLSGGRAAAGIVLVALAIGGLAALPFALPAILRMAARVTGGRFELPPLPRRAIGIAIGGNVLSWLLYGLAFQILVAGVLGVARGTYGSYVAAYASSYVLGYLALIVPGGIGVRDGAMALALPVLGLATQPQALLVAVASRLWLTVLEIAPGLIFLANARARRAAHPQDLANGST